MFRSIMIACRALLPMVVLMACVPKADIPNDPKKVLSAYISKSFNVTNPDDKKELVSYLARDAKARLSAWSEDQFRQAFIDNKRDFVKLLFTESKSVSPTQMEITYELTYMDKGAGRDARVTQKKLAEMVEEQGKWLIGDVQNIKELVEYRHEMSLP